MLRSALLLLVALLLGCQGPSAGSDAQHRRAETGAPCSAQSGAAACADPPQRVPSALLRPPRVHLELDGPQSARTALAEVLVERGFALVDAPPGSWRVETLDDEAEKLRALLRRRGCDLLVVVRFDAGRIYGRAIGAHTALQLVAQILPAAEPGSAARSFGRFIADTLATQEASLAAR